MKNLVEVRFKGNFERKVVYLSDLMITLRRELTGNNEVRKETLNGLYHNMRNLILSEIKIGDLEPIKMDLPEEEFYSLPNLNGSHVMVDDYLNNVRINYSNEWTPVLLYEKLFSNIVENKIKLLEIREELKERKTPLTLTKMTKHEVLDTDYIGNHKKKDLTISGLVADIRKLIEELTLDIFTTQKVQYSEIENLLKYIDDNKKLNTTALNNITRLSSDILERTKQVMYVHRINFLMARESYRALLELQEISYAINKENNDVCINVNYDSTSVRFLKFDGLDTMCEKEYLRKGYLNEYSISKNSLFNIYVENNNKRLQEYRNPISWIIKLYELLYCDAYLLAHNFTLTEENLRNMYKDILTHRAIEGEIDYINDNEFETEPENFFSYISENVEMFPHIFERIVNWFFDTYFFRKTREVGVKGLGVLVEAPSKITMKNFEYINEYLFTQYEKDLNILLRKVAKGKNKNL